MNRIYSYLSSHYNLELNLPSRFAIGVLVLLLIAYIADKTARLILIRFAHFAAQKSKNTWDDTLVNRRVFEKAAHMAPAIVCYFIVPTFVEAGSEFQVFISRITFAVLIFTAYATMDALLSAVSDIYGRFSVSKSRPIRAYLQAVKLIFSLLTVVAVISVLLDKSPWAFLSVLGGLTAVLLLVFKDTILGFVASIQLAANGMVAIGDWIEMPKYGADGEVIDITIPTVKVQNWDKTISTIPTYALITDAFKNWRGMSESGGRRIKRSINLDINSIGVLSEDQIARLKNVRCLKDYLENRLEEISTYNRSVGITGRDLLNGRALTNIGTFRNYILGYLKQHEFINKDMTFMVRQLEPGSEGVPIQVYVFCSDKRWVQYEAIQSDIFDHLLAALPEFGLRAYQKPSGLDFSGQDTLKGIAATE